MTAATDWTGIRVGMLTAARRAGSAVYASGKKRAIWECVCDCGGSAIRSADTLRKARAKGLVANCGCHRGAASVKHGATSGGSPLPEYKVWAGIRSRCLNPNKPKYRHYGGRGITICDAWLSDFSAFLSDMGPRPSSAHSIDRIDVDGPYSPENCRWATAEEQASNTRRNVFVTFRGVRVCVSEAARMAGLPKLAVAKRLRRGWTAEEALTTPLRSDNPNYRLHHHRWQAK